MPGHTELTKYEASAIIGFWRMGNEDAVIAGIIGCQLWQVQRTIRHYTFSL